MLHACNSFSERRTARRRLRRIISSVARSPPDKLPPHELHSAVKNRETRARERDVGAPPRYLQLCFALGFRVFVRQQQPRGAVRGWSKPFSVLWGTQRAIKQKAAAATARGRGAGRMAAAAAARRQQGYENALKSWPWPIVKHGLVACSIV